MAQHLPTRLRRGLQAPASLSVHPLHPVLAVLATLWLAGPAQAQAQAQSGESVPFAEFDAQQPHIVLSAGLGGQLRLGADRSLGQGTFAPSYADAMLGVSFPLGGLSIGAGLASSVNLEPDGGYTEPVFEFQQWSLTPLLLLYHPLGHDWLVLAHAGPSLVLQGPSAVGRDDDRQQSITLGSAGIELGAALGYRMLAGVLAYAELDLDMWLGEGRATHWVAALEAGLLLDYEVLP